MFVNPNHITKDSNSLSLVRKVVLHLAPSVIHNWLYRLHMSNFVYYFSLLSYISVFWIRKSV